MTKKDKHKSYSGKERGFTFIEILVSVFIFSLIGGAVLNLLISAIAVQQASLAKQSLVDQTSFTIEYLSRAIREAQKATDSGCIPVNTNYEAPSASRLEFIDISGRCRQIYLESGTVKEDINGSGAVELFSDELNVIAFNVEISGQLQTDDLQPRVTMYFDIQAKEGRQGQLPRLQLQTSISQRAIDVAI